MSEPIVVLGMHRSGTTMLTNALIKMGVNMGRFLDGNQEDRFFLTRNEMILKGIGLSWDNPFGVEELLKNSQLFFAKQIKPKNQGYKGHWGWKDPRTVLTLPVWLELYENMKLVIVFRDAGDVVNSLISRERKAQNKRKRYSPRNWLPRFAHHSKLVTNLEHSFKLWEYYNWRLLNIIESRTEGEVFVIKYEKFLESPREKLEGLARFLNLAVEESVFDEIIKEINPERAYANKDNLSQDLTRLMESSEICGRLGYSYDD